MDIETSRGHRSISGEVESNKVILEKNRKIKVNGVEYMDMGEDRGEFKLFNATTRGIDRVTPQQYI